ncbi:MAG: helix-turn-helix transcriptional regulator [Clostridia bacterium]|nr:helix-turn-helix transcriptional regulator [Clostridia bacterium]
MDKQVGGIWLAYESGFFAETFRESPQLYHVIEQEISAGISPLSIPEKPDGLTLLFCVSGKGVARLCEHEIPLEANTLICCLDTAVSLQPDTQAHLRYTCLHFSLEGGSNDSTIQELRNYWKQKAPLCMTQDATGLSAFFTALIAEMCLPSPMPALVRGLLCQILIAAYRSFTQQPVPEQITESTVHAVGHTAYAIIRYVDEHLYSMNGLMDMASALGYSYNYLSHLFRRKTGMTIQSYVSQKKIERSLDLLRDTDMSVTKIATVLNYDCIQSFSKAFKRAMNMSPTEYRARMRRREQ